MTAPWWRSAVIYQLYPRSFLDTNGDGIGDIPGITARLDYLAWLGVDALWLSPITSSPNHDWGYDVSDYQAVHPDLGTREDLEELIAAARRRGIRVLLDLVPNHTSDCHPWFVEARQSRSARRRAFYVWADPAADGGPPNNWTSLFGGPAWTYDRMSGQYYLHSFLPSQPDLNWWNDDVRHAFDDILRFWLDRGVAGFRIDVAAGMIKDRDLRDNPAATSHDHPIVRAFGQRQQFNMDRPEVHEVLRRWRTLADGYHGERVLLGEAYVLDPDRLAAYYGAGHDELHLAFNFLLLHSRLEAEPIRRLLAGSAPLERIGAWPAWAGSNHDAGRLASRWAEGNRARIRCALLLLLALRGTPVLYYGDEIGLPDMPIQGCRRVDPGRAADGRPGRDGCRTPMPWDASAPNAGFTESEARPWLPVGRPPSTVAEQRGDPSSTLHLCRDLIALRRMEPDLHAGEQRLLPCPSGVLGWRRGQHHLVFLNLANHPCPFNPPAGRVVFDTERLRTGASSERLGTLAPWQGVIIRRA